MSVPVVPSTGGKGTMQASPGGRANSSFTSSPHVVSQPQVKKIVKDIQDCLSELKREFEESHRPIGDDNLTLHRFCAKLEFLLQYGMKEKVTLLGRKKDYWDYFCDCLGSTKGVNDGINYVKTIGDYKTSLGKGRAFLRFSLMHSRMPDSIQQCVINGKITSDWYHSKSVWLHHEERSNLISALYDLNDLQFDLAPRGYDLDNAWPSFAKKNLSGVHNWNMSTMSRTSSMSSLSSIPGQDSSPSKYGLSSTPNDSADLDMLATESMHADLLDKVEALEQQKRSFQHSVLEIQTELDKLQELHSQLKTEHQSLSSEHKDLQQRFDRQSLEAETKDKEWIMKESMYTKQLEHAHTEAQKSQDKVSALEDKVAGLEGSRKDSDESNITRIADMEKLKADLQLQVRTLQQDLEASQSADCKKSEVIKSLEDKMETMEQKNRDLLDKMEDMVTNKNQVASSSLDSASKLQEMVVSLKGAESENVNLKAENRELSNQCLNKDEEIKFLKNKLGVLENQLQTDKNEFQERLETINTTLSEERTESQNTVSKLQSENSSLVEERKSDQLKFKTDTKALQHEKETLGKELDNMKEIGKNLSQDLKSLEEQNKREAKQFEEYLECEKKKNSELEIQIENFKRDVSKQEKTIEQSTKTIGELECKCTELEKSHRELDQVCQSLKSDIEGRDKEIHGLREQHSLEKGSADEVKGALQEKIENIRELETKERQLKQLLEWLQSSADVGQFDSTPVQIKDESFATIINSLLQNFKDKQKNAETLNVNITQLKEKCQHFQQESSEKGKQLTQRERDLESVNMCLKTAQDNENLLQNRCSELEKLVEKSSTDREEIAKMLEETETKFSECLSDCDKFKTEIKRLDTDLSMKSNEILDLRNQITKSEEKLHQSSDHIKKNQLQEKTLTEKIQSQEKVLAEQSKVVTKLQDDLRTSQQIVKTLEKDKENLLSQKSNIETFRDKLKDKYKESLAAIDSLKENVSRLTNEKKASEEKTVELKTNLFDTEKMLVKIKSERADDATEHEKTLARLQTERQDLTENLEEVLSDLGSIKDQLKETSSELENAYLLKAKIESERDLMVTTKLELESSVQQLESKCCSLESEIEQKDKDIADLSDRCNSLEMEKQALSSTVEEMASKVEMLENSVKEKTNQLLINKESSELLEKDLEAKQENYSKEIEALQERTILLENELETVKCEKDEVEKNLTSLKLDLEDKSNNMTQMSEANLSISSTLENLQKTLLEKSEYVSHLESEVKTKQNEFLLENDAMKQELSALQFQISTEQIQHEEALQSFTSQENNIAEMREKLQEQETLIEQLEQEMQEIKAARGRESNTQQQEVEHLKSKCESKEEEKKAIKESLQQAQLSEMKDVGKESESEITQLKNDTVQLKKKLIKLIKEKDTLWQKSDRLAYEQKVLVKEKWMDDRNVLNCLGCNTEFSFTVRKHHCRLCGKVYCYNCSNNWIMTAHSSKKLRACNSCYMWHSQVEKESSAGNGGNDSEDDFEKTVELPHRVFSRSSREISCPVDMTESSTSTASVSTGDNESITIQDDNSSIQNGERLVAIVPGQVATDITISLVGQNETDEIKRVKRQGGGSSDDGEEATGGVSAKDEVFHLISDEEIAKSLTMSGESQINNTDPSLSTSLTVSTDELEKGQINSNNETWIKPGKKFAVPIIVDRLNTTLCWEFKSQPKDIVFSVLFQEDTSVAVSQAQVLVPSCKCDSHKQAVKGELTAKQLGIYTLMFDNTYSRLTSKKVSYTLWSK